MHWSRWGDPAQAGPLPEAARALVDAFLGTTDTPSVAPEDVRLSDPLDDALVAELGEIVGPEHVLLDHDTRLHRTRGKSTPDLLKLRRGDGSDSPDAVVRPGSHDEVAAVIAWCVRRHVALVPFGGGTSVVGGLAARRDGFAGVISLDLLRFDLTRSAGMGHRLPAVPEQQLVSGTEGRIEDHGVVDEPAAAHVDVGRDAVPIRIDRSGTMSPPDLGGGARASPRRILGAALRAIRRSCSSDRGAAPPRRTARAPRIDRGGGR